MRRKKRIIFLLTIISIFGITTMTACGFLGIGGTEKWREEVRLSDGRVIVVYREIINEMGGDEWASNRSGLKPKEDYIRFDHPDEAGKIIEWRTLKKSGMSYPEIPLILDVENGYPVLFTIVGVRIACEAYNKYVYRNGIWIEEKLPETFEPRTRNLFVRGSDDIPKLVSLEMKRKIDESGQSRRAVRQAGPKREICG